MFSAAPAANDTTQERGRQILGTTSIQGGLVVHLGCDDGRLTAALRADDIYVVHGLDTDAENVQRARQHIQSLGCYGEVSVDTFDGRRLPYADNLVNLVVASGECQVAREEITRVLVPNGVALFLNRKSKIENRKWVKPWPDAMDEWTHFRHAADGNMVSGDGLVGPPRHVQWMAGPRWQRHHGMIPSITNMVSARGRMFYIADESPMGVSGLSGQWRLIARDAFNGTLLWKRPIRDWGPEFWGYHTASHVSRFNHPIHIRRRLVAVGDRVYCTLGFDAPVVALNAATGNTEVTYAGTQYADEFVHHDGTLYLSVNDRPQRPLPGRGVLPEPAAVEEPSQKRVWAVDAASGTVLWKSGPLVGNWAKPDRLRSMRHLNLTVCPKGVFLVDERHVVCLDSKTGQQRWRSPRLRFPEDPPQLGRAQFYHNLTEANTHRVLFFDGVLLVLHPQDQPSWTWVTPAILQALSPETGKELWRYETTPITCLDVPDVFGIRSLVWIPDRRDRALIGLDPATGKEKRRISLERALNAVHHHRCYSNRATPNYLIVGRRGAEFIDLSTGEISFHHWARGGCRVGHLLANGLFYRPPDHCQCFMAFQPRGLMAMASTKAAGDAYGRLKVENPLEKGPAYDDIEHPASSIELRDAWPTFRHDPLRSGSATTNISPELGPAWEASLGKPLTSPTIADARLYCCTPDDHMVHALDAATGQELWSFTAGGRVDSPPTVYEGLALFGCADGWVYCLRASDGALAWRFRAAPRERQIMASGRLESAWPAHGSVLVAGGVALATAGRSSLLDDGIYAYALDAKTGRLLERHEIREEQTDSLKTGQLPQGALSDILVSDGESIYLRRRKLEFAAPLVTDSEKRFGGTRPHLIADGGFFDTQWFHRASWLLNRKLRGRLIVFDEHFAYVAGSGGTSNYSYYVPAGGRLDGIVGKDDPAPSVGWLKADLQHAGYTLFAATYTSGGKAARGGKPQKGWRLDRFPICPSAMVVCAKMLFVAGFPDQVDSDDPWANFEGRAGGRICVLSAEDGEKLTEYKLDSPPVWNGMAIAGGKLYVATQDGKIRCFAAK